MASSVKIRDRVWDYVELGFLENDSARLLADELECHRFWVERGLRG